MANSYDGFIDIQMEGNAKQVTHMLSRLYLSLDPSMLTVFLGSTVETYIKKRASNRFQSEGDDVSGGWAPLEPATWNYRQTQGYGPAHPINHRTGALENYIVGTPGRAYPHSLGATLVYPGSPPTGDTKTKVSVAQSGQSFKPITVPRPVLGMNETDLTAVMTSLSLYLARGQL